MTHRPRVLVVDDHDDFRKYLVELLDDLGYDSTSAETGEEALRLFDSESAYDIVLSDVVMPGMSGVELARRIEDIHPQTPVLLMTGRPSYVEPAIEAGALPLLKPFSAATLERCLEEKLDRIAATRRKGIRA